MAYHFTLEEIARIEAARDLSPNPENTLRVKYSKGQVLILEFSWIHDSRPDPIDLCYMHIK